jgi:hypothetical protein
VFIITPRRSLFSNFLSAMDSIRLLAAAQTTMCREQSVFIPTRCFDPRV